MGKILHLQNSRLDLLDVANVRKDLLKAVKCLNKIEMLDGWMEW